MDESGEEIEEVILVSNVSDIIISQVCAVLDENIIPYTKIDEGAGAAVNVYMGFSNMDKKIIVSRNDYNKAKELISPILTTTEEEGLEEEDLPEELKEDDSSENLEEDEDVVFTKANSETAYKMLAELFIFILIFIPTIIVISALILRNMFE